jgi:hypothetical protein
MWRSMMRRAAPMMGGAWGWLAANSGGRTTVVDLGVEDGEGQAVTGQVVGVRMGAAGDDPVAA